MKGSSQNWWRPDRHAAKRPYLAARRRILSATRAYFEREGFAEVETPALQVSPGLEPHLMAFGTDLVAPSGATRRLHLHTSPEFAMKKLLVAGEAKIFQIARVFRNGERAETHHPEFAMLEWYRAREPYERLMADCEALLRAVQTASGAPFRRGPRASDAFATWERMSVVEAFARHAQIDLAPLLGSSEAMAGAVAREGYRVATDDSWDDLFFRVFLDRVEPKLGSPAPTILYDYPIAMAALSRPKAADPRFAERFELYVAGLEIANAFGELTDAAEQRRRFEADMAFKRARYGYDYPIDQDFLAALAHGMPEASGIALGFDRLVMLATGAERIEDVIWAPVAEAE